MTKLLLIKQKFLCLLIPFYIFSLTFISCAPGAMNDEDGILIQPPEYPKILSFTLLNVDDGEGNVDNINGNINGKVITLFVAEGSILTDVVVDFSLSSNARSVEVNGAAQISGIDSHDFSGDEITYIVYSDDGFEFEYTVKIKYIKQPPVYLIAFNPDYTNNFHEDATTWIDIKIKDISKISGNWKVKMGYGPNSKDLFDSTKVSSWKIENGDIIRIHGSYYTGISGNTSCESSKEQDNSDRWDCKSPQGNNISYLYGTIWIEDSTGILDIVTYRTTRNTNNYWISSDPLTKLENSVKSSLWPSSSISDAINLDSTKFAKLVNVSGEGNSAAQWEGSDILYNLKKIVSFEAAGRAAVINGTTITIFVSNETTSKKLAARFELESPEAVASVGDVILESGITEIDYSSDVIIKVTAEDSSYIEYTVRLVENDPSSKEITSFAFRKKDNAGLNNDIVATINGNNISAAIPKNTNITTLVAEFIHTGKQVLVENKIQESGITTNNFTNQVTYVVHSFDGNREEYIVSVELPAYGAAVISAMNTDKSGMNADGKAEWVEIKINDVNKLKGEWKVRSGTNAAIDNLMSASSTQSWMLENNDIIRLHPSGYTGTTDTNKNENNTEIWDLKLKASKLIDFKYGIIWIEDNYGNIIDLVAYSTEKNSQKYWLVNTGNNPLDVLNQAVKSEQWVGSTISDAFVLSNSSSNYARLINNSFDGNAASDWQECSAPLIKFVNPFVNPRNILVGTSEVITISVQVQKFGGADFTNIQADLSELGGNPDELLYDDGTNGDNVESDNIYSYQYTVPGNLFEGNKKIIIKTLGSTLGPDNENSVEVFLSVVSAHTSLFEGFEGFPETGTSFLSGTFTSTDTGITWTYSYCSAAAPGQFANDGAFILFQKFDPKKNTKGELVSSIISGGASAISFDYMQPYANNVNLDVFIIHEGIGTLIYTATTSNEKGAEKNTGDIIIPSEILESVANGFSIKFAQRSDSSSSQVSVDNLVIKR